MEGEAMTCNAEGMTDGTGSIAAKRYLISAQLEDSEGKGRTSMKSSRTSEAISESTGLGGVPSGISCGIGRMGVSYIVEGGMTRVSRSAPGPQPISSTYDISAESKEEKREGGKGRGKGR